MLKLNDDGTYGGSPEEIHTAVVQLIQSRKAIMEKCLLMAQESVTVLLQTPHIMIEKQVALDPLPACTVIETHIGRKLTDDEVLTVVFGFTQTFAKGFSACDIWTIAHAFEHEFYPDSPPKELQN